uniref:N/A n=1 Tax=Ganoderma boninense TaxID=34458 RepID=A0A5K1K878_9APHY|nr:N/A [Ganoderma boninense]
MSTPQNRSIAENWRNALYTFADENKRIFTVTNCPPIIHPISTAFDGDFLANRSLGSLLRPQLSANKFPELPFLLQKLPLADPLLSRLCIDPTGVAATRYEGGWALEDKVRNAWIALEKGLLHISEILLTSSEESSVGTSGRYAIRHQEHWPPPEDYGYRNLHSSARAAENSIRHAHGAFQLLAARCSLAIALWQFPAPLRGKIPVASPSRYDSSIAAVVPDWIPFLRQANIPSSWIDALTNSALSDFSINLRVGTVYDPTNCPWLPIATVLRAANVPVFVLWPCLAESARCIAAHPYMKTFAPHPSDASLALCNLPGGQPRVVTLCRDLQTKTLPNYSILDDSAPPFGPYQLPRESREDFFVRRERYRPDQIRRESMIQKERRHLREAHADTGRPPCRRSRVYLWVKPELIFPGLNPCWAQYEYRYPIPPPAFQSLWIVHPASLRRYNSFYDEWDLWFPIGWRMTQDDDPTTSRQVETNAHQSHAVFASPIAPIEPLPDEHDLLNPPPEDRNVQNVAHPDSFVLQFWYGIRLENTRVFTGVDYKKFAQDMWHLFGETKARFPTDEAFKTSLAGWVSAVMARAWSSQALEFTWDLDSRHPHYLGTQDARLSVSIKRLRSPERKDDPDNTLRWVKIQFVQDPEDHAWSLLTTSMGALLLIRRIRDANTSCDALHSLLCAGIPARTGVWIQHPPARTVLSKPRLSLRRLQAPWRKKGERPTIQDYDAYYQRVLELCHSPHMRAAWLKGGIVWRIMVEVTGKHPQTDFGIPDMEELQKGPSGLTDHHEAVTLDSEQGGYYDDSLSRAELDIIAGVVRVYTGHGDQTEDASWWPKHSMWVRAAAYTGIWSPADERWFQRRLKDILEGREGPLNAGQWKTKMKRQQKAGKLAEIVDHRSSEFIYRNLEGHPVQSAVDISPI